MTGLHVCPDISQTPCKNHMQCSISWFVIVLAEENKKVWRENTVPNERISKKISAMISQELSMVMYDLS
jgi:hypothetical protein